MEETAAAEREWIPGRNGGRLRNGGTRGPSKEAFLVKQAYLKALDKAGGWKFFYALATGSAEDKRTFALIGARLFPLEVRGVVDSSLTVKVVQQLPDGSERVVSTHAPGQGTCVIAENERVAPMPAPITVETDDVSDAEVIER